MPCHLATRTIKIFSLSHSWPFLIAGAQIGALFLQPTEIVWCRCHNIRTNMTPGHATLKERETTYLGRKSSLKEKTSDVPFPKWASERAQKEFLIDKFPPRLSVLYYGLRI